MALIKFEQDGVEGDDGEAYAGDADDPVEVSNSESDTATVASWEISLVDLPFGSALSLGVLAQGNGATPSASFQPDESGCYRVMMRTWPQANRQGRVDVDIRNFGIPEASGVMVPPSAIWPEPLPDPRTGRPGAKPGEMNFAGQLFGWAGTGNDGLLRHLIRLFGTGEGLGDVVGPGSSVNNRIAVFNGTTGKLLADGGVTIADLQALIAIADAPTVNTSSSATPSLALSDRYLILTNAAPTLAIPTNATTAFPIGTVLIVIGTAGQVTITSSGITLVKPSDCNAKSRIAGSSIGLKKVDTNTWHLSGDLEPTP